MTNAEKTIAREHDIYLLKQGYLSFIKQNDLSDCFENIVNYLDSLKLFKTKV